ncbi:MAG: thioredoxin family protein [Minisyncoccia bacterium]
MENETMNTTQKSTGPSTGIIIAIAIAILAALGFMFSGSGTGGELENAPIIKEGDEAMMEPKEPIEGEAMMKKGSYEPYAPEKIALAAEGDVVLFFHASWCPTCRALDENIQGNAASIPESLTILDVNYDKEIELRKKYGVTMQHTLVQVDAAGTLLAKWTGSPTLSSILEKVQ